MHSWEKKYLEALIDTLRPFGDVLEVGFHEGYAAEQIEKFHPKSHTIIESDPAKAKKWVKKHPHITLVEDTWRNALPHLGIFDAIFFDVREEELLEGDILVQEVQQQFPELKKMRYSEKEVDLLCKEATKSSPREVARFLYELEHNGQISAEVRKKMAQKYHLKEMKKPKRPPMRSTQLVPFLEECSRNHMRKGSRFSCFSSNPTSKYEDSQFAEKIIADPFLDYKEWILPPDKEVLVILVEKL